MGFRWRGLSVEPRMTGTQSRVYPYTVYLPNRPLYKLILLANHYSTLMHEHTLSRIGRQRFHTVDSQLTALYQLYRKPLFGRYLTSVGNSRLLSPTTYWLHRLPKSAWSILVVCVCTAFSGYSTITTSVGSRLLPLLRT